MDSEEQKQSNGRTPPAPVHIGGGVITANVAAEKGGAASRAAEHRASSSTEALCLSWPKQLGAAVSCGQGRQHAETRTMQLLTDALIGNVWGDYLQLITAAGFLDWSRLLLRSAGSSYLGLRV